MVLSATQTRPSLRWPLYVCPYIPSENPLRQSDSYHLNINSDTYNNLKPSVLPFLPPQLIEGKRPVKGRLPSVRLEKTDAGQTENVGSHWLRGKQC